ncbi:TLD domain-containing protein 1 [Phytophthora nicotianae]|uniref:TLD domain-containing protein 1 n=2 Tax=Phytophthora nicotianae TaxID=4792 RepID=A0A0W8BLQ8_PHYNI|nr:TLD domain-containing protein 1 [Phytophthora nicotianae]
MGNNGSSATGARAGEWKGPFSDEEYECLKNKFDGTIATAPSDAAAANLQMWLELPMPATAPSELTEPFRRLGAAFYQLCLQTKEDGEANAAKLQMVNFAQGVAQCVRASSQAICRALFRLFASNAQATAMTEQELSHMMFACLIMAEGGEVEDVDRMAHVAKTLARAAMPPSAGSTQASSDDFVRWTPLSRLYTSAQDGLSFNRLSYHILGYSGPTLTIIRDTQGAVFGMFCDTEWKESSRYYGGNGCFLFRLAPEIAIYRVSASGANENYMYLNSKGFALPRGLGMGGSTDKFRLFLSEDLDENSYTTAKCLSFEPGRLSSSEQFVIDAMEVWGCGGEESELSQKAHRQETADLINRARKVDKAQFVGNDFDKEMFLGKTFGHGTDKARIADDEQ